MEPDRNLTPKRDFALNPTRDVLHGQGGQDHKGPSGPGLASGLVYLETSATQGVKNVNFHSREDAVEVVLCSSEKRARSLRASVITGARLMSEQMEGKKSRYQGVFVTLTYRPDVDWSARHVTDFLKPARQWASRKGLSLPYVWVAELHKSGRVHFHVLLFLPVGINLPKPDKRGWWPHGMTKTERARNAVGYMAKYVSKGSYDHPFPPGLRSYCVGGLEESRRRELRWWKAPGYARHYIPMGADIRRAPGGWVDRDTGLLLRSPFEFVRSAHGYTYLRFHPGIDPLSSSGSVSPAEPFNRGFATH